MELCGVENVYIRHDATVGGLVDSEERGSSAGTGATDAWVGGGVTWRERQQRRASQSQADRMGDRTNGADDGDGPASLEYEEDCYYAFVATPSFDAVAEGEEDECVFVVVEEEFDEPVSLGLDSGQDGLVEAEWFDRRAGRNKWIRGVKVRFEDLSKPYLARITGHKGYSRFLQLIRGGKQLATHR
ncbi:hypothetical protein J6590_012603 [Homalodisca vitripennis]|nr:hypothetical protein J6590_012603 [Homalodisca vitripennis]